MTLAMLAEKVDILRIPVTVPMEKVIIFQEIVQTSIHEMKIAVLVEKVEMSQEIIQTSLQNLSKPDEPKSKV